MFFGVAEQTQLALVLQMGMPPAFATVVFAEAYGLDRELAVTTLVFGCLALLVLLPLWVLLFGAMT
jgi:predicted permease